jgi:hypothetical protein
MGEDITGLAVYLVPGMSIKIKSPVNGHSNQGYFVRTEALPENYFRDSDPGPMVRGFVVENKNVGYLQVTDEEEAAVVYVHNKPYGNAIWFFALTGEKGLVKVVSVPIHDHSTIIHGGPAYGTYFDDDIER